MTVTEQSANMGRTTVSLDAETADALHQMKERGDSYDDVIRRLIEDCADSNVVDDPRDD
jgi:predicted CopG family antitoxin